MAPARRGHFRAFRRSRAKLSPENSRYESGPQPAASRPRVRPVAPGCSASVRVRSRSLRRGRVPEKPKLRSRSELSSIYAVGVPRAKKSLGQKLRSRAELSEIYDVAVLRDESNVDKSLPPVRCFRQFIGARLLLLR